MPQVVQVAYRVLLFHKMIGISTPLGQFEDAVVYFCHSKGLKRFKQERELFFQTCVIKLCKPVAVYYPVVTSPENPEYHFFSFGHPVYHVYGQLSFLQRFYVLPDAEGIEIEISVDKGACPGPYTHEAFPCNRSVPAAPFLSVGPYRAFFVAVLPGYFID